MDLLVSPDSARSTGFLRGTGEFDDVRNVVRLGRCRFVLVEHRHRLRQQSTSAFVGEQTMLGFLQRGEMRRLALQTEDLLDGRAIVEDRDNAAIVNAKEFPQHEAGEQL